VWCVITCQTDVGDVSGDILRGYGDGAVEGFKREI
jgi:hypothetical protein